MPKRHLNRELSDLVAVARIIYLNELIPPRTDDPVLLDFVVDLLNEKFPLHVRAQCFFFTLDQKLEEDIGKKHRAHQRVQIEKFNLFRDHKALADRIRARFHELSERDPS